MAGLTDVVRDFAKRFGVTQSEARKCIEFFTDDIIERCGKGETVSIRGFGVFKVKDIGERTIKNPQTGEPTHLDPSIRVCFTATDRMKKMIKVGKGLMTAEEAGLLNEGVEGDDGEDAGDEA